MTLMDAKRRTSFRIATIVRLDRRPGPAAERWLKRSMDLGERAFSVILFAGLVARLSQSLTLRPWDAIVLVAEGLVAGFMVFRRGALSVSTRPADWFVALAGTAAPMLVRGGGHALVAPAFGASLMLGGMVFSVWGKLILRRGFGLAAANRGVVDTGAFSFVRHPIYTGYAVIDVGFFLLNPLPWNAAVYLVTVALMAVRILAEEKLLAKDPAYQIFMGRVRYRMAPGLF